MKYLDKHNLNDQEKNNLINVISSLSEAGMLCSENEKDNEFEMSKVLLGDFRYNLNKKEGEPKKYYLYQIMIMLKKLLKVYLME